MHVKPARRLRAVTVTALLLSVAAAPPAVVARTHAFDLQHSKMTVHVSKQGALSFLADNHEIEAPITSGSFDDSVKSVEVSVDAAKLVVVDANLLDSERKQVQSNMLGPGVLDVVHYPTIAFRSTKIDDVDSGHWKVAGELTLHGQTHPLTFVLAAATATHFSGSATVRQTQYGINPIRIAGGAVSVRDDVTIEFQVELTP